MMSKVEISGIPALEIAVEIPEATLLRHKLTFDEVANAIRTNNTDISGGIIKATEEEMFIRFNAKRRDAEKFDDIILRSGNDGSTLRLGDIAQIREQFADVPDRLIYNGNNAVAIRINKLIEEDLLLIADTIRKYVPYFNAKKPRHYVKRGKGKAAAAWSRRLVWQATAPKVCATELTFCLKMAASGCCWYW